MMEEFEKKIETAIRIKVHYRTATGEIINDAFLLDLSIFRNLRSLGKPDMYRIATDMEKIQQDIHQLVTGFSHLNVITQTRFEYLAEQKADMEEAESFFEEQRAKKKVEE
jgi:DNA mismatch repair ATPase MutS